MYKLISSSIMQLMLLSCNNVSTINAVPNKQISNFKKKITNNDRYKQIKAIPLPTGYTRVNNDANFFADYLRDIKLKESSVVYLYNGQQKENQTAQYAVLDISVGDQNLQQCADAVMRLRAEYLFAEKQFGKIVFYDNEKTAYQFSSPYSRANFTTYLNRVFGMCGSASLSKQLNSETNFESIKAGDVIIRGGFPGHAVMVMDVAENAAGNKIYMLAQSYMPAQDIHVLKNPMNADLSPWYEVSDGDNIETPEYTFTKNELKQW